MIYSNTRLREICEDYIHNERDRNMFYRKFGDGITLERLAEEYELSVSQVKRIIKKHYFEVFRHFEDK